MTSPFPIQIATSASLSSTGVMRMPDVMTLRIATTAHVTWDTVEMDSPAMVSYTSIYTAYKPGEFMDGIVHLASFPGSSCVCKSFV